MGKNDRHFSFIRFERITKASLKSLRSIPYISGFIADDRKAARLASRYTYLGNEFSSRAMTLYSFVTLNGVMQMKNMTTTTSRLLIAL